MQTETRDFLNIIKSGLLSQREEVSGDFVLEDVIDTVSAQNVTTLFYHGLHNCGIKVSEPHKTRLLSLVAAEMAWDEKQRKMLSEIKKEFSDNGISYMILKGSVLKELYPAPEMRAMGDIDILIKLPEYEKISVILESLGYEMWKESSHELVWTRDGAMLELHKILMPSYNEDFDAYFGNGWQRAKVKEKSEYRFSSEDMFIYLFVHFTKHYRDGGAGVMHLCDLYLYMKKNEIDEAYVKGELEKLGLSEFYENVRKTLEVWFGETPETEAAEIITSSVINHGKFGDYEDFLTAEALRSEVTAGSYAAGRVRSVLRSMFPPLETMKRRYKRLGKFPFLLPFLWITRLFRIFFTEKSRLKRKLSDVSTVSDEKVRRHDEALRKVGLSYKLK